MGLSLPGNGTVVATHADRKELFLRADAKAEYGAVVKALAAAREAGAKSLGMVTEPER